MGFDQLEFDTDRREWSEYITSFLYKIIVLAALHILGVIGVNP